MLDLQTDMQDTLVWIK